ncbi:leucine-rich repeat-containing protein 42-like isoform X2 [Mizuhopecten yessoensis]|nr:leucine-rich repeat-containing protein 42-like isoform X2 [Mizuhopecten yessoensis]
MPGINYGGLLGNPRFESESARHAVTTPISLLKLVIHYVSQHLELVESLVGFPEIVGELIFRAAETSCKFYYQDDEYHDCLQRLKLFTQAYGEVVLSKLSMSGRWSSLELYKDHIQIFRHLTELELAECGLGDDDELLPHIGQHLPQLKCLSLRHNKLTDKGLVKLTTPYRVMGAGPRKLALLNLSDNQEITGTGVLKYLSAFQDLSEINITGTSVKRNEALLKTWKFDIKKGSSIGPEVTSFGWASDVVDKWAAQAEQSLLLADNDKTATQKFYSNKRMKEVKSSKLKGTFKKTVSGYNIVLSRLKEGVTISKEASACHKFPQRKDGISEFEQRAHQHPAKRGHFSSESNSSDDTELTSDSDTTGSGRICRDSTIQDSEMMLGYLNTFKSVNLHTFPSEEISKDEQVRKEKTASDLHVAKRRKINICRQRPTDKSNDDQESKCDELDQEHLLKGIDKESVKNVPQITQPTTFTTKTFNTEMTNNDLQIMMGYLGSNTATTGDDKGPVTQGIFGHELPVKQEAKLRFFDKGEAELMERSTKDSVRLLNRKKSLWKQINRNIP